MVTFICEFCNMTLRKKQCERHVRGECSPGSLTCIDCSKNFPGTSYKSHTTCISEQDKHWGEFAPSRKPQPPIRVQQTKIDLASEEKPQCKTKSTKSDIMEWKGWKNELKSIIRQNDNMIEKDKLIEKAKKKYESSLGDEQVDKNFIEQKIKNIKKSKENDDYISQTVKLKCQKILIFLNITNHIIQQMDKKLQKPHFVNVSQLENLRDGYNVYVTVVSVEKSVGQNGNFEIARAVVADDSGCANAFFKGENVKLIKEGSVIAIRNGRIKLIKGHICLEVDIFGRITQEKIEMKPNTNKNISQKEISRKPRRNFGPRKDNSRREEKRQYRREDRENNRQHKEYKERKDERRGDDRRRNNFKEERKPKIEWTKIAGIEPGDEDLNLTAKVLSIDKVKGMCRVVLGDESAIVKGFIPFNQFLQENETIVLFRCEAAVVREHIQIKLMKTGKVDKAKNRNIEDVDRSLDISEKAWVESA